MSEINLNGGSKKIILNGTTYYAGGVSGGGSSAGLEKIYITQTEYDNLPYSEKIDSSKIYFITPPKMFNWDFTQSLTDLESGRTATLVGGSRNSSGLELQNSGDYVDLGYINIDGKTIEIDVKGYSPNRSSFDMFFINLIRNNNGTESLLWYNKSKYNNVELGYGVRIYNDEESMYKSPMFSNGNDLPRTSINNKTIKLKCENTNKISLWIDDVFIRTVTVKYNYNYSSLRIGGDTSWVSDGGNCDFMKMSGIRVYGNEEV